MPFTPIHMGPGIAIKAVLQDRFSLMVFGWSQMVMDVQPLISILGADISLHGFSHTLIGASLMGIVAVLSGKYLSELGLRILKLPSYMPIKWSTVFLSSFIGVYSHVMIDSVMHMDVHPFVPFSQWSPFYHFMDIDQLHLFCLVSGMADGMTYFLYRHLKK